MSAPLVSLVETFLNGNLKEARAKGKRRSHRELRQAYEDYTGSGNTRVSAAFADFIKGECTFQEFCNIKHDER